jgi:hypothetical protein
MAFSNTLKQIFFFFLVFVFFIFFSILSNKYGIDNTQGKVVLGLLAIFYSLGIYGYARAVDLLKEPYCYQTSPGKLCLGGPYTWQGNSPRARMCRAMASTPEGNAEIQQYNCGPGFVGQKASNFRDTPMSNDNWQNELCDKIGSYDNNSFLGAGL